MYTELDYLPDIKSELRSLIRECQNHMQNNTFDEETFMNCFNYYKRYTDDLVEYNIEIDDVNTSPMLAITDYYNLKSIKYTYNLARNEKISKGTTSSPSTNKVWEFIDNYENVFIFGGLFLLIFFLLRSCAHGETIDEALNKYVLVNPGNDKVIEFMDESYKPIRLDKINPDDFSFHKTK